MPSLYAGFGTEEIVHDVAEAMLLRINDEIPVIDDKGVGLDQRWAELRGVEYEPVTTELIDVENFHLPTVPSFVNEPDRIEAFPCLAVAPGRFAPDPESARADQYDVFQNYVSVYVFVKAKPDEGPDVAVLRAVRSVAAMYRVIRLDTKLRQKLSGASNPMQGQFWEPWAYPPEDAGGEDWWWSAGGAEFLIKNYATAP